ncbi:conserved hypothetical protein, partial [Clostridium carboxidivorans P7]
MINKKFKKLPIFLFSFIFILQSSVVCAKINDNQTVEPSKIWTVTFTQELVLNESNKQNITVKDSKGNVVSCKLTLGQDGKSVIINPPAEGFISGEKYTLNIGNQLKSKSGKKIRSAKTINFTIRSGIVT